MKLLKSVVFFLLLIGFIALPLAALFAQSDNNESAPEFLSEIAQSAHSEAENKALRDAAVALKSSRPDLADKMIKYAESEAKEKAEWKDLRAEEKSSELINDKEGIKLLQNSIPLLKGSNPELAGSLSKYLDKENEEIKTEK